MTPLKRVPLNTKREQGVAPDASLKSQYSASAPFQPLQETLVLVPFPMNPNYEEFVPSVLSALTGFFLPRAICHYPGEVTWGQINQQGNNSQGSLAKPPPGHRETEG